MKNIQEKLDKYNKPYVHGEQHTNEYNKQVKRKHNLQRRYRIAENFKYEAKYLLINDSHIKRVKYLISVFNDDFNGLHNCASEEVIILVFFYYYLRLEDSNFDMMSYRVTRKYNLSYRVFNLIVCRMLEYFMRQAPVVPWETTVYDHDLLLRNNGV